jgi:hypothetical protein
VQAQQTAVRGGRQPSWNYSSDTDTV